MSLVATVMTALAVKHFMADYVFNPVWTVPVNKHIYGSRGSLEHSGLHALFCFLALVSFIPTQYALYAALFDGIVHYHEDYIKTKFLHERTLSRKIKQIITGADQLVHILTYVIIVAWIT